MTHSFESARQHFVQGLEHHAAGRLAQAEMAFLASLDLLPGRASTLMNLGAVQLALDRADEALQSLDASLAADAAQAQAWCHRAAACLALARPHEALQGYEEALRLEPDNAAARYHLALTLGHLQRHKQAYETVKPLLKPDDPASAPAWLLAGQTLQALDQHANALPCYQQALALQPQLPRAHVLLGQLLQLLGQHEEAAGIWRQGLHAGIDADLNRYLLAGLTGGQAPVSSPGAYVRSLFDPYAEGFDEHLLRTLHYRGHTAVVQAAERAAPQRRWQSVLDLGCGTGLCGRLIRPLAEQVSGVDLSPTMIRSAGGTGAYDTLFTADITEHLQQTSASHDLLLAADVFIYIGELAPVLAGVQRVLQQGGLFCFTVETPLPGETMGATYVLRPSLRYAHDLQLLRQLAQAHGLTWLDSQPLVLRKEQGQPIDGAVVTLGA